MWAQLAAIREMYLNLAIALSYFELDYFFAVVVILRELVFCALFIVIGLLVALYFVVVL